MKDGQRLLTSPGVQLRKESEDFFFLYFDEQAFETNSVGARIIELCREGIGYSDLCRKLADEFDAAFKEIRTDTAEVLDLFLKHGIVRVQGE